MHISGIFIIGCRSYHFSRRRESNSVYIPCGATAVPRTAGISFFGEPRIELGLRAPKARVLPLYDSPKKEIPHARILPVYYAPLNNGIIARFLRDILSDRDVLYRLSSSACSKKRQRAILFFVSMTTPTTSIWNSL